MQLDSTTYEQDEWEEDVFYQGGHSLENDNKHYIKEHFFQLKTVDQVTKPFFKLKKQSPTTTNYELSEKFNFFIDLLCDDFCEIDENGQYSIKPEVRAQIDEEMKMVHMNKPEPEKEDI